MKLYRKKYKDMIKSAGIRLPKDPKMWASEVLKTLVTEHPYIDTASTKITFSKVEPESDETVGKIIVENKVAIPFSIRENPKTKHLELDKLDILFDGERFMHLNEYSIKRSLDSDSNIKPHSKNDYGSLPPQNRYIGDRTGDVTPLEYSGYPTAGTGGGMINTAGSGLLSRVIRSDNDISALRSLLVSYPGINSIAEVVGLNDSLQHLSTGMVEREKDSNLAHIMRRSDGSFAVAFGNGDTRVVSISDLQGGLGPDFKKCMRKVMQRGWCIIRDFPTLRSVEQPLVNNIPSPVQHSGRYRLMTPNGDVCHGYVFSQMIDFDGSRIKRQKAVLDSGESAEGIAFSGVRVSLNHDNFPIGCVNIGVKGCFVDESYSPSCTPDVIIKQIIGIPGEPDLIIGVRTDTGGPIGVMIVDGISRPQRINVNRYDSAIMPKESYYIPSHMSFIETSSPIILVDKAKPHTFTKIASNERHKAVLRKNANMFFLHGETLNGPVDYQMMSEEDMRLKLAHYRVNDDDIEKACKLDNGSEMEMWGLVRPVSIKTASTKRKVRVSNFHLGRLKTAADKVIDGVEEMAGTKNPSGDQKTLDAILSLQFINDDTLSEIVESEGLFIDVEDKIAKLLLASRQGEPSVHEKGAEKALSGLGEVRRSLQALKIELQERNV